jgi:hypothetical protein
MRILKSIVRILFINMKSKKKIKCISDNKLEIETIESNTGENTR